MKQIEFDFNSSNDNDIDDNTIFTLPQNSDKYDDLPIQNSENGYLNFQQEQVSKIKKINNEWGSPINKNVNIIIKGMNKELHGMIILLDYPNVINKHQYGPLKLRLNYDCCDFTLGKPNSINFTSDQIESWSIIED